MRNLGRWRRSRRRGVTEVVGAILLIALTIVAGLILWTFRISIAPTPPQATFVYRSGLTSPVWGDPTDCQPQGTYAYSTSVPQGSTWGLKWHQQCSPFNDTTGAPQLPTGNFSLMNSTEIIVAGFSPSSIPLSQVNFAFVCFNSTGNGGTTTLVSGSLAAMTWFPGQSIAPSVSNPPTLGFCGNFNASSQSSAFGTLYNRLGIFIPIHPHVTTLQSGDTFLLYIHNGGWPVDFMCVDPHIYGTCYYSAGQVFYPGVPHPGGATPYYNTTLDGDDYHGAPPWCFTSPNACEILITYTGSPSTVLATIPVFELAPPTNM